MSDNTYYNGYCKDIFKNHPYTTVKRIIIWILTLTTEYKIVVHL